MFDSKLRLIYDDNLGDIAEESALDLGKSKVLDKADVVRASVENSRVASTQYDIEMSEAAKRLTNRYNDNSYCDGYIHDDGGNLISTLTVDEIRVPGGYSIKDALLLIKDLHLGMGDTFYGVLLKPTRRRDGYARFNPLHPLIAAKIQYEIDNERRTGVKYDLIVYSTTNFIAQSAMVRHLKDELIDLVVAASNGKQTREVATNFQRVGHSLTYQEQVVDANGNSVGSNGGDKYHMIPAHICGYSGLAYPYYGTSLIKRYESGDLGGQPMSPMLSANIGAPYEDGSTWESVCTGSVSSSTDEGLQTLNHSNLDSPMNSLTWNEYCYPYAQACIETSLELYFGDYTKEENEQEEITEQTEQAEQEKEKTEGESNENMEQERESDRGTDEQTPRSVTDNAEVDQRVSETEWDEWSL